MSRASATDLPLTAALIIEADDWLIEQPWPEIFSSRDVPVVVDVEVDHDLVTAQGVEALDPMGGRGLQFAPVPGAAVVVEDDLAVEIFEVWHGDSGRYRAKNSTVWAMASPNRSTSSVSL